jgi:hypothetical protein
MGASVRLPLQAAKVGLAVARERLSPVHVTALDDVPPSGDALTTQWLTAALCDAHAGAAVNDFAVVGGSDGTSSRRAVQVTYNDAGQQADLPTRLFIKSAASLQSRLMLVISNVTESETIFYRDLRPQLDRLRSPRALYAACDPRTCRSIVVMEDLAAQGWSFPDPMRDTVGRSDAEDMVDQMAYYHARFWDRSDQLTALPTAELFQERLNDVGLLRRAKVGIERGRSAMTPALWRRKGELLPATMRSLRLNTSGTPTLLHQDVHQGNWLRDPKGRMGLYDWQPVAKGEWALDVSYALSVNLTVENRRAWERELVERYLWRLGEEGATSVPTFDEAWLSYRQQPFHVVIFAAFTIGAGRLQPDMQPKDYMLRCWERICAFVDDHDSLDCV